MKKNKKNASQRKYDRGQIFVKVVAGILAILMVAATLATIGFAVLG